MRLQFRILSALTGISFLLFTTAVQADGYYVGIAGGQAEFESDHILAGKGSTIDNKSSAGYIFFGREIEGEVPSPVDKIDLKDDGVDVMSGLGIVYAAIDQVALMAGMDGFGVDGDTTFITYVGLKFSFD